MITISFISVFNCNDLERLEWTFKAAKSMWVYFLFCRQICNSIAHECAGQLDISQMCEWERKYVSNIILTLAIIFIFFSFLYLDRQPLGQNTILLQHNTYAYIQTISYTQHTRLQYFYSIKYPVLWEFIIRWGLKTSEKEQAIANLT